MSNDGGPAFPTPYKNPSWPQGMSLRDWFAGMADDGAVLSWWWSVNDRSTAWPGNIEARWAYADAMLAAREAPDA